MDSAQKACEPFFHAAKTAMRVLAPKAAGTLKNGLPELRKKSFASSLANPDLQVSPNRKT